MMLVILAQILPQISKTVKFVKTSFGILTPRNAAVVNLDFIVFHKLVVLNAQ